MIERTLTVWPPLPPGAWLRRPRAKLPFPLDRDDCILYARARHGLFHAVGPLAGSAVLVPAYHHGSEIEAYVRAGVEPRFYRATADFEPDADELESLLDERVRALHLIHYLGLPAYAARWRAWCDERGLLLVEDAAQAWLASEDGRPVGSLGDVAIFSLYKTFGIPDGAAAVAPGLPPPASSAPSLPGAARVGALWVGHRAGLPRALTSRRQQPYSADEDFALGDPLTGASAAARFLLPRVADPTAAASRRANYSVLLDALGELAPERFRRLDDGASPLAFPIDTDDKERLLPRLAAGGVRPLDLWTVPHPRLPVEAHEGAMRLRRRTLGLPVHQELRRDDVDAIVRAVKGARPPRPVTVETLDGFDALGREWDELAERSRNVFATRDFLALWWSHFGGGRRLVLRAARTGDGRVAAVLPLYEWRTRPARVLRLVGHRAGDELGPVCAPEDRHLAAAGLRSALAAEGAAAFLGEQMRGDAGWDALLGAQAVAREGSPVLPFRGRNADELVASWRKSVRDQVRSRRRRLERDHDVRFRLADDSARLGDDVALLFRLHRARWAEPTAFAAREEFHRDFARVALERGWLRLWFLEVDGGPVAAWYGFRFGGAESYYQMGREPEWDRASVGAVLLAHTILAAADDDGVEEYRFLRGDEPYKYRFAETDPGLVTVALGRGAAGAAAVAAAVAARNGRRGVRAARAQLRRAVPR